MQSDSLKEQYQQFLNDPLQQLRVKVRRYRAAQLRQLLANPDTIDLSAFNREVWVLESKTLHNGQVLPYKIFEATPMTNDQIRDFDAALNAGEIELHGNYIWGNAARVYGAALQGDKAGRKEEYIHDALRLLNSPDNSPLEKAKAVDDIPGFGWNTATGMVMVYHPDSFAIYNEQSKKAVADLGYQASTLESFEASVSDLKNRVGAHDFIELDWFLYIRNNPQGSSYNGGDLTAQRYWWVFQGRSYEIASQEGSVQAPKVAKNGAAIGGYTNVAKLAEGDIIIHCQYQVVRAVSRVIQPSTTTGDSSYWGRVSEAVTIRKVA